MKYSSFGQNMFYITYFCINQPLFVLKRTIFQKKCSEKTSFHRKYTRKKHKK